jgi:hypothetical protein
MVGWLVFGFWGGVDSPCYVQSTDRANFPMACLKGKSGEESVNLTPKWAKSDSLRII